MHVAALNVTLRIRNQDGYTANDGVDLMTLGTVQLPFNDIISVFFSGLKKELLIDVVLFALWANGLK